MQSFVLLVKRGTEKNKQMKKRHIETKLDLEMNKTHQVWYKFANWMIKTYGKDLHGEWQYMQGMDAKGKKFKYKYRSFNDLELSRRLVGYEAITKVEKFIKRYCPEIKIISCDDSVYSGSLILLIPHPNHGISVIFIPQCTDTQNQFFLYKSHYKELMKGLKEMASVYAKDG
jgi:hypothetical protein